MAMTLRLADEEHGELRTRAAAEGISMHEAVRRAIRDYVELSDHRERVATRHPFVTSDCSERQRPDRRLPFGNDASPDLSSKAAANW